MQVHGLFPLTLTLSPGERELLSAGRDLSLDGEPLPARAAMLPLPTGEGWGEGESGPQLHRYGLAAAVCRSTPIPGCSHLRDRRAGILPAYAVRVH